MKTYLRRRRLLPLAMLGLLVALLGLLAQPQGKAHAATATFISCPTETALRTAISNASSGDTIQFLITGSPCTISLTTGPIVIDKDLTLDASKSVQPVTLDGGNTVQVLQVNSGTFTLNTLTIAHGSAKDSHSLRPCKPSFGPRSALCGQSVCQARSFSNGTREPTSVGEGSCQQAHLS